MKSLSRFYTTDQGGRPENEDACGATSNGQNLVFVVADGLGGQGDGRVASALAAQLLLLCGADGNFPNEAAIQAAFQTANEAILARQQNQTHMKTTAGYLCIAQHRAIWAHIGDSRLYHFYNGKIAEYTLDHSVSQMAVLLGEITHAQIPGHADRSRLLKALGCESAVPTVHAAIELRPGKHSFLLCSDGFWEYVPEPYMESSLNKARDAQAWNQDMTAYLNAHCPTDHDNYTAVTVCLEV